MTQTTTIKIDIAKPNIPVVIYAKQHDKDTRKVEASLYNNGQAYTIPASASGQVNIAKPDGTGCYYDVDSMTENKVTFTLVEQALAAAGTAKAEVSLFSTEDDDVVERLTSFSFDIIIEKRVIEDSTLVSSDYYNALLGLAETVQRSVTFTPSVSSAGLLTWSNNGGLTNPESVNIKGPAGQDGQDGQDGTSITFNRDILILTQGSNYTIELYSNTINTYYTTVSGTSATYTKTDTTSGVTLRIKLPASDGFYICMITKIPGVTINITYNSSTSDAPIGGDDVPGTDSRATFIIWGYNKNICLIKA